MHRKLIWFECKKVLKDRRFLGIWLLLLVLQVFLTVRAELPANEYTHTAAEYEALYEELQALEPREAVEELGARIEAIEKAQWDELMAGIDGFDGDSSVEEKDTTEEEEQIADPKSPKREAVSSAIDAILPQQPYAAEKLIRQVYAEITAVVGRDDMVAKTIRRAEQMQGLTLFQGAISEAELGNLEKTKQDFLTAISIPVGEISAERGVVMVLDNPTADVFVFLMLFVALHLMVSAGYENGMETLVLSCREGRGSAIVARVTALCLLTGVVWASFFVAQSAVALTMYSWGDLGRPIQMVSDYVKCLFSISVGGLFVISFLWKWLWFFLFIVLQMSIMKWLQREVLADGLIAGAWGLGFFLWENIAENSIYRIWKYINVYYLLRPDQIWAGYNNIRVGSLWVNGWLFASVVTVLLLIGSLVVLWLSRERILTKARSLRLKQKKKGPSFRRLLSAEFYKGFVVLHIGLLFVALFWLQWDQSRDDEIRWGQDMMAYRSYMVQWERELTGPDAELERLMAEEEAELLLAFQEKSEKYSREMAEVLQGGLSQAKLRYEEALRTVEATKEPVYYFFEGEYVRLVDSPERDILHGAQASLLIILLVAYLVGREHATGMRRMIRSSGIGEARYYRNKLLLFVAVVFLTMLLVYGPDLWLTKATYGFGHAGVSIWSVPAMTEFPADVSIGSYLVILYTWRFFVLMVVGVGGMAAVEMSRNTLVAIIICVIIVWMPYLLYYLGATWASSYGIVPILCGQ